MMRRLWWAVLGLIGVAAAPAMAQGQSDWGGNDAGKVRLIAAATHVGQAQTLRLGLHFQLAPGWKIYWRTPGDAGYPPKIDWTGSVNAEAATLLWPAPKRFVLAGLQNHGYAGEVVLPLDVAVPRPGQPVALRAALDYLACAQICVPMQATLALDLDAGTALPSPHAELISRFVAQIPRDGARHGLRLERAETFGAKDDSVLRVRVRADRPWEHPDIFVEPPEVAGFEAPVVRLSDDRLEVVLESKVVPGTLTAPLDQADVTVTVVDGTRSFQETVRPAPGAPGTVQDQPVLGGGLAAMLAVALLGGLILNAMPCVLPVLSLKLLGALGHGGGQTRHIRAAFVASALGIVASFWLLAGAAIGLKLAGAAVGWGIQFQQPWFLAAMIVVLLGFALNVWGLFEIRLPSALMNAGGHGRRHTLAGHFLSGVFATLLATPCSAPFLGTALGFALARGPLEIAAIFTALGLGMAAPYGLVALVPQAARALPRPGAWMVWVRRALGVALAGTALWLGSILLTQVRGGDQTPAAAQGIVWQPFDVQALAAQVTAGKVVLVDVTADWCITCKVNKAAVLDRAPVLDLLVSGKVVAMRADWTRPDDRIARYLESFGRYGIPFNAVYGPRAPQGIALPELLGGQDVLDAVAKAAGG